MVRLLLSRGADANVADNFGYTPLKMATKANHLDIIRLLKGSGQRWRLKPRSTPRPADFDHLPRSHSFSPSREL